MNALLVKRAKKTTLLGLVQRVLFVMLESLHHELAA